MEVFQMKLTVYKREDGVILLGYPPAFDETKTTRGCSPPEIVKPGEVFASFTYDELVSNKTGFIEITPFSFF
jgi:hypothetical protein